MNRLKLNRAAVFSPGGFAWIGALILLAGCVSQPAGKDSGQEELANEVLGEHEQTQWSEPEEFSRYPAIEIQTKVADRRIVSESLVQADGRSFSGFGGKVVGYPASLRVVNKDVVAAEIVELDIWRRPEGRFGSYDRFLASEPIALQPGESWEGSFVVSRKNGWFRLQVRPAAPEGWEPVHGSDLRNVFFRSGEGASNDLLQLVFWNLGETEASFRFWVAEGIPSGIPENFTATETVRIPSGQQQIFEVEKPRADWALVTKPVDSE